MRSDRSEDLLPDREQRRAQPQRRQQKSRYEVARRPAYKSASSSSIESIASVPNASKSAMTAPTSAGAARVSPDRSVMLDRVVDRHAYPTRPWPAAAGQMVEELSNWSERPDCRRSDARRQSQSFAAQGECPVPGSSQARRRTQASRICAERRRLTSGPTHWSRSPSRVRQADRRHRAEGPGSRSTLRGTVRCDSKIPIVRRSAIGTLRRARAGRLQQEQPGRCPSDRPV